MSDAPTRRDFVRWMGAGAASTWLACSSRPARDILPYATQPPELVPGVALHYATALVEDGFATGVLATSRDGRPTKIEGNPDHPASRGATRATAQAAVMSLYDPQRARAITEGGVPASWTAVRELLAAAPASGGAGLEILMEPTTSPMVIELITRLRAALPAAHVTMWSAFEPRASLAGNRIACGRALQTQLDLREADVVVALDADVIGEHAMGTAYARQLADRRRVVDGGSAMSRIYAFEAGYSQLGVLADHRVRVRPSAIAGVARDLFAAVQRGSSASDAMSVAARDLVRAGPRGVVIAGEGQPPVVHALAAAINDALGSRAAWMTEPVGFEAGTATHDLDGLVPRLGEASTLLVLGGNPAYTASTRLADAIARVPASLYLGSHDDETAAACHITVPALHDLERWGAARAYDGTLTPIQPLIEPLFGGFTVEDVLHELLGDPPREPRERFRDAWQRLVGVPLEPALARGAVAGSAAPRVDVRVNRDAGLDIPAASSGLDLQVRPHPFVHDGRHGNNPWLLELPEPITKLTWGNAAQLSPATAGRLDVDTGDVIAIAANGRVVEVPAIVVAGHADDAITLHAGFGRRVGIDGVASGIGAAAFALGPITTPVLVRPTGASVALAITQLHAGDDDRAPIASATLAGLSTEPVRAALARRRGPVPSLLARHPPTAGPQWAMSIDLTTCSGCTACVMACAAENNTPVVGAARVLERREMHWLRIDRYVDDGGTVTVQPMACQHCETAPCEYVCPVGATTHSPDGLNEMAYNRCVGTRFCSNNCPYKVRRFNWFDFKPHGGLRVLGHNPDVTVRDRGVMEKCTYCVQRIRRAEIDADVARAPVTTPRTACQQACPTQAIAFGSIAEATSDVSEHRTRPHAYAVLHERGTAPRTQYLARVRNPNPELA